jgi:hypothetical protein
MKKNDYLSAIVDKEKIKDELKKRKEEIEKVALKIEKSLQRSRNT